MTPEEIVAAIDARSREILASHGAEFGNEYVLDLMNEAGMSGFQLGCSVTRSMFEGAFAVKVAQISK